MSKKSHFRRCFEKQYGKCAQAQLNSASQHRYHIHSSLLSQLSPRKFVVLTWKILELLVNTLAADEKYPVLSRDNLRISIHMQLSQKQIIFSDLFAQFLKSGLNFEYFEKKDDHRSFCISDITDSEKRD